MTQSTFDNIDAELRQRYLLEKDNQIEDVINAYSDAIDFLNAELLASGIGSLEELDAAIESIVRLLDSTTPAIERQVRSGYNPLIELGIMTLTLPLVSTQSITPQFQITAQTQLRQDVFEGTGIDLSDRIWSTDKKQAAIKVVQDTFLEGGTIFEAAQNLKQWSIAGNGFYNAYRLAHTEYTSAFSNAMIQSAREWNSDPNAEFEVVVEQYLSPTHNIYDVCDIYAGFYAVGTVDDVVRVPQIPRHPNCNCGQKIHILTDSIEKQVKTVEEAEAEYRESLQEVKAGRRQFVGGFSTFGDKILLQGRQLPLNSREVEFIKNSKVRMSGKPVGLLEKQGGAYNFDTNELFVNTKVLTSRQAQINSLYHELGHALDKNLTGQLLSRQEYKAITGSRRQLTAEGKYIIEERLKRTMPTNKDVQTMFDVITGDKFAGDESLGFLRDYYTDATELFAEGYAIFRTAPNAMKRIAPSLFDYYSDLL